MNCEKFESRLTEYITGTLSPEENKAIENHLAECESCRLQAGQMKTAWAALGNLSEAEPSPVLRGRFYTMLENEKRKQKESIPWSKRVEHWFTGFWPRRPVIQFSFSLGLLVIGLVAGGWIQMSAQRNGEVAQLRREVADMKQTVSMTLMNQSASSSERLRGINLTSQVSNPTEPLLETLLNRLNFDPSVNVRLAAVDALYAFSGRPGIRDALIQSLATQTSPLVQISLIDLLVLIREKHSLEALRKLIQNQGTNETVKEYAEKRIAELS
jgi:hypothetical protein